MKRLALIVAFLLASAAPVAAATFSAPVGVALSPPFASVTSIGGVACPSANLCVAVDNFGNVLTSMRPSAPDWSVSSLVGAGRIAKLPGTFPGWLFGLACPSTRLCVAVDHFGDVVTSTDPTGGASAWQPLRGAGPAGFYAGQMSCPSTRLCAVGIGGEVLSSSDPVGGAAAWHARRIDRATLTLSCPSTRLCVGADALGRILTSTHPRRGARAWRYLRVERQRRPGFGFTSLSCASVRLCAAVNAAGRLFTSTAPARSWHRIRLAFHAISISCPATGLCVAGAWQGLAVSRHPGRGPRAWRLERLAGGEAVQCPRRLLCFAFSQAFPAAPSDNVLVSRAPARTGSWSPVALAGFSPVSTVSCPSGSLCVAAGNSSHTSLTATGAGDLIASSANPAGAWSETRGIGALSLSCPSSTLCVGGDTGGDVITGVNPAGGLWSAANVIAPQQQCEGEADCYDVYAALNAMACTTSGLCVGLGYDSVTGQRYLVHSSDPTGGASAWHVDALNRDFPGAALSCASPSLCVAVGGTWIASSTTPTVAGSWSTTGTDIPGALLEGVACETAGPCVAVDDEGAILTSSDPAAPGSWTRTTIDGSHALRGVTCASRGRCLAFDDAGNVVTSTTPADAASWTVIPIVTGFDLYAQPVDIASASCPSADECVTVDTVGDAITSQFGG